MRILSSFAALDAAESKQIALCIAVAVFALVLWYTFDRRSRARFERARHLPLDDARPVGDYRPMQLTNKENTVHGSS
ncbi:MAG: cbb3-type cytochrome oxidase subunit 3 [Planctomycetota bacterium]